MSIDLYYRPSPPSLAVFTVAKILGLEINVKNVDLANNEHLKPEYIKLNPNHTIPTLVDKGFPVFESGAIVAYLVNQYKPGHEIYPNDPAKRAKIDEALHFLSSGLQPAFISVAVTKYIRKQEPTQEALDNLKEKLEVAVKLIGNKKFLTGETLSIADILLAHSTPKFEIVSEGFAPVELVQYYERVKQASPEFKEVQDSISFN